MNSRRRIACSEAKDHANRVIIEVKQEIATDGMVPDSHFAMPELCVGDVAFGSVSGH
jgi:hypothetical protein